jgi:uncharacterized protein (DUF1778 family)
VLNEKSSRARGFFGIRLSEAERRLIERAASERPESVSRWIRNAAIERARLEVGKAGDQMSGGRGE